MDARPVMGRMVMVVEVMAINSLLIFSGDVTYIQLGRWSCPPGLTVGGTVWALA